MKKLIITAHPSKESHTSLIKNTYESVSKENNDEVKILNLYAKENLQDFLSFQEPKEIKYSWTPNKHQELILRANELVFIFPIWWWWVPAILKNWLQPRIMIFTQIYSKMISMTFWMKNS